MGHSHSAPSVSLVPATTSIMTLHNDASLTLPPLPTETDGATVEGAVTHVEIVSGGGFKNPVEGGGSMLTVSPRSLGAEGRGTSPDSPRSPGTPGLHISEAWSSEVPVPSLAAVSQ